MLVGHFTAGLLAKRAAPKTSLGTLILGAMLADCLAAAFLIVGLEHWRMVPGESGVRSVDLYDISLSHSLATGACGERYSRGSTPGCAATGKELWRFSSCASVTGS